MVRRAISTWVLMVPIAFINGIVRDSVVAPRTGELSAHQMSVFTGSSLFFTLIYAMWHRDVERIDDRSLMKIGGVWTAATIVVECGLGRARGMSWEDIFHDYDVLDGRLWPVVLLVIGTSPLAVKRLVERPRHPATGV